MAARLYTVGFWRGAQRAVDLEVEVVLDLADGAAVKAAEARLRLLLEQVAEEQCFDPRGCHVRVDGRPMYLGDG